MSEITLYSDSGQCPPVGGVTHSSRAELAHIRQSRPDSGGRRHAIHTVDYDPLIESQLASTRTLRELYFNFRTLCGAQLVTLPP